MNLALIGYRGTGKSVISKRLAATLKRERVGMDELLVERFDMTIPEFVSKNGWDAFRDAESALAREIAARDNLIIDCGGGVVVRDENIQALKTNARLVWLQADVKTIAGRIHGDTQRPSLTNSKSFIEEIEEVLTQRTPLYTSAADWAINTEGKSIDAIARSILDWFSDRK